MGRTEYNTCVADRLRGKTMGKEERKLEFCVSSKICSGKASTPQEAEQLCRQPKMPKWAKQEVGKEDDNLTCPERIQRISQNIDVIRDMISEGQTDNVKPLAAQSIKDIMTCGNEDAIALTQAIMEDVKDLGKGVYFKKEGKEVKGKLNLLQEVLNEGSNADLG